MLAAMAMSADGLPMFNVGEGDTDITPLPRARRRNKFGLTDEELERMADMSPKEKKLFLKGRE